MAQIGNFNAGEVNPNAGFDPIPPGTYVMKITNSDVRSAKSNPANKYIWLEHTILEGEYKGRLLFNNLNYINTSVTAANIAAATLSQLCRAVGKMQIGDTVELHGIPFQAQVSIDTKGDKPQNRIDKYLFEETNAATTQATRQATVAAGASAAAPWAR